MTPFHKLSAAGFAATAISYGPARVGFGLFVPEFRETFGISTTTVGYVSSLGFLGFFAGLILAQTLLILRGPKAPVLTGLFAATAGTGIVAAAPSVGVLAAGVFLAASSAGFAWTPFNDAVHREVRDVNRPTALAEISTGTALGIVAAGLSALLTQWTGVSWRACWAGFAVAGALIMAGNWAALRGIGRDTRPMPDQALSRLATRAALPLFAIAFVFGTVSSVYLSFAADHMRNLGGVPGLAPAATPGIVFVAFGVFGLAGLATARIREALGSTLLLRALMLAGAGSLALAAVAPTLWAGVIASGGLQGIHVMMTSAMLATWSERLFPALPATGFTAALLAMAAGSVIGPALAGLLSEAAGPAAMFLAFAVLPTATALALRDRHVEERPVVPCTGAVA